MTGQRDLDGRFLRLAVRMAERGLGATAPNPSVGAILVRFDGDPAGTVVGRGWTQPGGRPHAETEALRAAGEAARGATLYVTLEPCSHHGKTPPCAEAVIAAGVARVVVGIEDPDPRVSGRGLAMLRAAGIETVAGLEAKACRRVTFGHILRVTNQRPMVTLKMALAPDGSVPRGRDGRAVFVTGTEARALGHLMRARSDAILVGRRTVTDDDPELTCRLPGLVDRSPVRVVLDGRLDGARGLTPDSKLARSARDVPVWVVTAPDAPRDNRLALEASGVRVLISTAPNGQVVIDDMLSVLAKAGVTRLLVEGGYAVWRSFSDAGRIDEVVVFQSSDGSPTASDRPPEAIRGLASGMYERARGSIGADVYVAFEREDI